MIEKKSRKREDRIKLSETLSEVGNGSKNNSCDAEIMFLTHLNEKCKDPSRLDGFNEYVERFRSYLEGTSIWFSSIVGLKTAPSSGTNDDRKMAQVSLEKLVKKVNEFHNFRKKYKEFSDYATKKKESLLNIIEERKEAIRVKNDFKNIANSNLNKLELITSSIRHLIRKMEYNENYHQQKAIKIRDALIKYIILSHKPIQNIRSRFE